MAEAICKIILARRFGCQIQELEQLGYLIRSAGVAATNGVAAAPHAIEIIRDLGGSLENHRSRNLASNLVRQADCIFAMTADHLESLLEAVPDAEHRTFLLDPDGRDLADPYGSDHDTYRRTAQMIEAMLEQRLDEMGL